MAAAGINSVSKLNPGAMWRTYCHARYFNTSSVVERLELHFMWKPKDIPKGGTEYSAENDHPDWSYADGKPAPIGVGKRKRVLKHMDYCKQIVQLTKEIDEAKMLTQQLKDNEKSKKEIFARTMLKRKGDSKFADERQ